MIVGVKGTPEQEQIVKSKLPSHFQIESFKESRLSEYSIVFDLTADKEKENRSYYNSQKGLTVFVSMVKKQLEEFVLENGLSQANTFIGINALPTFFERDLLESTAMRLGDREKIDDLVKDWSWQIKWVESRVGMVTPRVVFMIINEAYYTVQEGTANQKDIDTGMKLGTAYPMGPFEWKDAVGVRNVYETLEAVYEDTKEERYKICPMLKTEYLKSMTS
jgi:3-hydroxybutyryl-CoA dehydrogenase